jgi:hypothetical protein
MLNKADSCTNTLQQKIEVVSYRRLEIIHREACSGKQTGRKQEQKHQIK